MQIPSYKGDETFAGLLKSAGCKMPVTQVRAAIMANIWSIEFIPPSAILEHILPLKGEVSTACGENDAKEFLGQFLALYNVMSDHQDPATPFRFHRLPPAQTWENFNKRVASQHAQVHELFALFRQRSGLTEKNNDRVLQMHDEIQAVLHDLMALLNNIDFSADVVAIKEKDERLDAVTTKFEALFNELGQIYKQERQAKMFADDIMGEIGGDYDDDEEVIVEKVGRNDPCPCGSGKKFKKCCLH